MTKYTLIKDNEEIPKFKSVDLSTIDKYTTQFDSVSALQRALGISGVSKLKIYYNVQGTRKKIDVAYSDKKKLQDVVSEKTTKIDLNNRVFISFMDNFIKRLREDSNFFKYIINSYDVNAKIKEYATLAARSYDPFFDRKLREYAATYLQFRKLLFVLEKYNQPKIEEKETVVEPSSCLRDDDRITRWLGEDNNFTEEELEEYEKYMDNLPGEEPDFRR